MKIVFRDGGTLECSSIFVYEDGFIYADDYRVIPIDEVDYITED